jgi:hypothetical protein
MVAFSYQPRTRPPQPVLSSPFPFLSTVKSLPEEWFQITSTISAKSIPNIEPIDCHVSPRAKVSSSSLPDFGLTRISNLFFSCSFLLCKHFPFPIRFRSTCSSSPRPSRCRRSCIPSYRPIQNLSVRRAPCPRALRRQRCACIYSDKSLSPSKATNRRVNSQLARVTCAPFPLVPRRRPYCALNLWDMDSARSTTRGKCVRILTSPWASLV